MPGCGVRCPTPLQNAVFRLEKALAERSEHSALITSVYMSTWSFAGRLLQLAS